MAARFSWHKFSLLDNYHQVRKYYLNMYSPGALDLYPDKIHTRLIFFRNGPKGTYINIIKVTENPSKGFREIQDGVQDGRRHIVISRKLCKSVNFSSIFFSNISFQLILLSINPSRLLPDNIDNNFLTLFTSKMLSEMSAGVLS